MPKPASPGENAVYRVGPDGVAREVFRAKVLVHALAWQGDRLLVGTGPDGQLYEVRDGGRESAPIARLDSGQVLALANERDGGVLVGTGDPGSVVRLTPGYVPAGTLTSDVHDAKYLSRFGAIAWKADVPGGTSLAVQVRSGNVGEPDATWSPWSPEQSDADSARAAVPPGRFLQYRAILRTDDPAKTPELRSLLVRYQTENLAPEINKLDVPDVSAGDGATKPAKLSVRWDAVRPERRRPRIQPRRQEGGLARLDQAGRRPDHRVAVRVGRLGRPVRHLSAQGLGQRPPVEPPRAGPDPRPRERGVPRRPRRPERLGDPRRGGRIVVQLKDDATRLTRAAYALDGGPLGRDLPRRRPLRRPLGDDHPPPGGPQARHPPADDPCVGRGGEPRDGRPGVRDPVNGPPRRDGCLARGPACGNRRSPLRCGR